MIDLNADYTELLQYNKLMNPKQPQPVKAASAKWVRDCLESCGWSEGDNIPSGLGNYLDAVIKACGLVVSPKSAKEVVQIPLVNQTLTACLQQTKDFSDLDKLAEEETEKILGSKPDLSNSLLKQIYDITKSSAKKALQEEQQKAEEVKEPSKPASAVVTAKEAEKIIEKVPEAPTISLLKTETPEYKFCPCCGISLTEEYSSSPITENDRTLFLQYVLGGDRFYKTYPLWGGQVNVTLHTMTPEEERIFDEEYSHYCIKNRDNYNMNLIQRTFTRYKMAGLIDRITFKDSSRAPIVFPNVFEAQFDPGKNETRVNNFLTKFYDKIITSVEMQRAFDTILDKYLIDMDNLRKNLYSQDFWNGGITA